MPKPKNPRRVLVARVRAIDKVLIGLRKYWAFHGSGSKFDAKEHVWRPRRPDEYPETDPNEWVAAANDLWRIAEQARQLAIWCEEQVMALNAVRLAGRRARDNDDDDGGT